VQQQVDRLVQNLGQFAARSLADFFYLGAALA
jgi:hypothetical protein